MKTTIAIAVAAILLIAEIIHLLRRKAVRAEAREVGLEEYLRHLKNEYQEMQNAFTDARTPGEKEKYLRRMSGIEKKMIQIEDQIEQEKHSCL